jgi:hypothetical protein
MSYTIIGVHGLANKPPKAPHELDWIKAITEGLQRNFNVSPTTLNFRLVYWAAVMYQQPVVNDEEPSQWRLSDPTPRTCHSESFDYAQDKLREESL